MDIFESLENLNVSEECFDEIMDMVEEIINESPTYGVAKSAVSVSLPSRMQKYREVKSNPSSTPKDIERASSRLDKASEIGSILKNSTAMDDSKLRPSVKQAIKNVHNYYTMSPEARKKQEELKRQKDLQNMWQAQVSHGGEHPRGYKYPAILKTNRG